MPSLIDQLILHEGIRLRPYVDTVGKVTIGIGRNLTDNGISMEEARQMLTNDIEQTVAELRLFPWFDELDPIRRRVLIDMCFNLGLTSLRGFRTFLACVARKDWEAAAESMLASKWASQVGLRAKRLAQMLKTGEDYDLPAGTVRA